MTFLPISRAAKLRAPLSVALPMVAATFLLLLPTAASFAENKGKPSEASIDWTEYMSRVQATVKKKWHPTPDSRVKSDALSSVKFQIKKDGLPLHVLLSRSSGVKQLDQEAVLTIFQCKFDPLPAGAPEVVDVDFAFDYKVNDKGDHSVVSSEPDNTSSASSKPLWGEKDGLRPLHYLMRAFAPVIVFFILLIQTLMLIIFMAWNGIERLKLFFTGLKYKTLVKKSTSTLNDPRDAEK